MFRIISLAFFPVGAIGVNLQKKTHLSETADDCNCQCCGVPESARNSSEAVRCTLLPLQSLYTRKCPLGDECRLSMDALVLRPDMVTISAEGAKVMTSSLFCHWNCRPTQNDLAGGPCQKLSNKDLQSDVWADGGGVVGDLDTPASLLPKAVGDQPLVSNGPSNVLKDPVPTVEQDTSPDAVPQGRGEMQQVVDHIGDHLRGAVDDSISWITR